MSSVVDSLKLYLHEIGQIPQLSREEEYNLSVEIQTLRANKDRTVMQQARLDEAINRMIEANLRLVVSVAKKYTQYAPLQICISGGNLGLMRAVPNFDARKGTRFSTYATIWIRQNILLDLNEKRLIQLPIHVITRMRLIRQLTNTFVRDNEREPTEQELLAALRAWLSDQYVAKHQQKPTEEDLTAFAKDKNLNLDADDISELLDIPTTIPLDAPVNESGGSVADMIEAAPAEQPTPDHTEMRAVLMDLSPEARKMLKMRLGFFDNRNWRLVDVGREFRRTRERVRQVEQEALKSLSDKYGADLTNLLGDDE